MKVIAVNSRKAGKFLSQAGNNVAVAGGLLGVPVYEFLYW